MRQPPDRPRAALPWRVLCACAVLFLTLGTSTNSAQAQDPVEELYQAIQQLKSERDLTPAAKQYHEKNLSDKVRGLRTINQLRRAIMAEQWKGGPREQPLLTDARRKIGERLLQHARTIAATTAPELATARLAVANLIAEIGPSVHSIQPAGGGLTRTLTKEVIKLTRDPSLSVRLEALRALGNIDPPIDEAIPVFLEVLRPRKGHEMDRADIRMRRQAAEGMLQMMRVVTFLRERGKSREAVGGATPAQIRQLAEAVTRAAGQGLDDPDPDVRRLSAETVGEAARTLPEQITEPLGHSTFPPAGRPLTEAERADIRALQAEVRKNYELLVGPFNALRLRAPQLVRLLHDADPAIRTTAASALEAIGKVRLKARRHMLGVPSLTKADEDARRADLKASDPLAPLLGPKLAGVVVLLRDPLPALRRQAVMMLELLEDLARPALPALAEALGDPDRYVRWSAARAIGNIGPREASFAVPGLAKLLADDSNHVRLAAMATLEAMGRLAAPAVPALAQAAMHGDSETRVAAIGVLGHLGPSSGAGAIPALIESLTTSNARVRRAAATVLGSYGPAAVAALPALRRAVGDEDQEVRMCASEAILNILLPPGPGL